MPAKSKPKNQPILPFTSESAEACFLHFSKIVSGSPAPETGRWNADAELLRVNVCRGVEAILPHLDTVAKTLPLLDRNRLMELPALARALGFAADRVFVPASAGEIQARQRRLRPTRALTLAFLEVAAGLGLVPAARVAKIRAGKGPIDEARDAVAIAALFNEHAGALANKHPFSKASLDQLAEDGDWLLAQLLPASAAPEKAEKGEDARVRDQLWNELRARYDDLFQAGVAVWGRRGVEDHIPALRARAATPKSKASPAPAEPAAPPPA